VSELQAAGCSLQPGQNFRRGPKTDIVYLFVVDENRYARGTERTLFLLVLDENRYAREPERIFYMLVVDGKGYDLKRGQKRLGLFSPLSL